GEAAAAAAGGAAFFEAFWARAGGLIAIRASATTGSRRRHEALRRVAGVSVIEISWARPGVLWSEHQLHAGLEKVGCAACAEPVQHDIAVPEGEPELVGGVPSEHRRHPPELAALNGPAVGVRVAGVEGRLEGSHPALEERMFRIDEAEQPATGVVRAYLAGHEPRHP